MRILIVEDEARIADFLERGLRAEGHFCVVAKDGKQGLSLALEGDFDLAHSFVVGDRLTDMELAKNPACTATKSVNSCA